MKEIELTNGHVALVDDCDYETISVRKWHAVSMEDGKVIYAHRTIQNNRIRQTIQMHREILGITSPDIKVDHKDHNGLNNQRGNLRACSNQDNVRHQRMSKHNTSGFKGVSWYHWNRNTGWRASIMVNKKTIYLGIYKDPRMAALAYDEAARKHFGEFAKTNGSLGNFWNPHWEGR